MEGPGHLQLVDVALVDLVQRGKAVAGGGVAPVRPVLLLGARLDRLHRRLAAGGDHVGGHEHVAQGGDHANGQHTGHRERATPGRTTVGALQAREHQRDDQADHGKGQYPRDQRPEVQAGIPHRPDRGEYQGHRVQPGAQRLAPRDQHTADQHRQAHQKEVPATTEAAQVRTAPCQHQADQGDQDAQTSQQPLCGARSTCLFVHVITVLNVVKNHRQQLADPIPSIVGEFR